jgi:DNA polymerase-3 subunit alpha
MAAIKNVGINAVAEIKNAHDRVNRKFTSIYDFCSCVDTRVVNKRVLEGLVLAGAFDSLGGSRSRNFMAIEEALSFGSKLQSVKNSQEGGLFADDSEAIEIHEPELPIMNEWESKERLSKERQVLGFYLSDHPLRKYEAEYYSFANVYLGEQETYRLNEVVRACGVITDIRTRIDKAGRQMAFFKLDDFSGSCECLTFSKVYKEYENLIEDEATVIVRGMLESSGDAVKLNVEEIIPLADAKTKLTRRLGVVVDGKIHNEKTIAELKKIFENSTGSIPVSLRIINGKGYRDFYLSYKTNPSDETTSQIIKLLGEDSVRYFTG